MRAKAVGPRGDDHAGNRVMPHVAPVVFDVPILVGVGENRVVRVRPTDVDGASLRRSRVVGDAEMQRLVPRARAGDVVGDAEMQRLVPRARAGDPVHVLHAERRLDDHLEADALLVSLGDFDLIH